MRMHHGTVAFICTMLDRREHLTALISPGRDRDISDWFTDDAIPVTDK